MHRGSQPRNVLVQIPWVNPGPTTDPPLLLPSSITLNHQPLKMSFAPLYCLLRKQRLHSKQKRRCHMFNHRLTESAHCALGPLGAAIMLNAVTKLYFMYIYIKRSTEGHFFMGCSLFLSFFSLIFFVFFLIGGKKVV